jgi:hypothetical protein
MELTYRIPELDSSCPSDSLAGRRNGSTRRVWSQDVDLCIEAEANSGIKSDIIDIEFGAESYTERSA